MGNAVAGHDGRTETRCGAVRRRIRLRGGHRGLAGQERRPAIGRLRVVDPVELVARVVTPVVPGEHDRAVGIVNRQGGLPRIVRIARVDLDRCRPGGASVG